MPAAPTWMRTGAGARLAATPSCRGASASSKQVLAGGGLGARREAERVGNARGAGVASTGDLLELCARPSGAGCPHVLWDPNTLCPPPPPPMHCVPPRCPPHAQVELQRQLSQVTGGLVLDPLPGPLLHLPYGDHPGTEGCHEEVPERYGEGAVMAREGRCTLGNGRGMGSPGCLWVHE